MMCALGRGNQMDADTPTPPTTAELVADVTRLLQAVHVLDCGTHYCRYCPAKSPDWDHTPGCPYVESQRDTDEARALIPRIAAALAQREVEQDALRMAYSEAEADGTAFRRRAEAAEARVTVLEQVRDLGQEKAALSARHERLVTLVRDWQESYPTGDASEDGSFDAAEQALLAWPSEGMDDEMVAARVGDVAGAALPNPQTVVRPAEALRTSGEVAPVADGPDSVAWWREVAQGLGVECHALKTRAEAAEARITALEQQLADAQRVISLEQHCVPSRLSDAELDQAIDAVARAKAQRSAE